MSVFDGIDFSDLEYSRAEKNIADDWDCKHITTRLEFQDQTGQAVFAVRSSYTLNDQMERMYDTSVKISCDNFKNDHNVRIRAFGANNVSESVKKDLDLIEKLFHSAPDELKRVY